MNDDVDPNKPRVGWLIALGVVATLFFGVAGAFVWFAYVWMRIPADARARVSPAKRAAFVVVGVVVVGVGVAGVLFTIAGLVETFRAVALTAPERKAEMLSSGISEAMNATAYALVAQIVGVLVAFVVGVRLLRST